MKRMTTKNKKNLTILIAILLLAGLLVLVLEKTHVINLYGKQTRDTRPPAATTSKEATAQNGFSGGDNRQPLESNRNEGTVSDNKGNVGETPSQTNWTFSQDKTITVYTPSLDGLLVSGGKLSGASQLSTVSFRLIDDVTGVIAQGTLKVVDGKYSGTFDFKTTADAGRLDVFSIKEDGSEISNVEVPVRFK